MVKKKNKKSTGWPKWKLVEKVVAEAFKEPNVQVRQNVMLKSLRRKGGKGGFREIDVLITGSLAGQEVNFAIECKDYKRKIGSPEIDAFIGKLQDIGLPPQASIYVTTGGYTIPAVERAHEVGIKTLILNEYNFEKEKNGISKAIQSHIFMLCSINEIKFKTINNMMEGKEVQYTIFYNKSGQYIMTLSDVIWQAWLHGMPPQLCDIYSMEIVIPEDWKYHIDGSKNTIYDIKVTAQVSALIQQIPGDARQYHFENAQKGETERNSLQINFEKESMEKKPLRFTCEESIKSAINTTKGASVIFGRIPLPKIVLNQGILYPIGPIIWQHFVSEGFEKTEKELEGIIKSEKNNFWDFDEPYAKAVKLALANSDVKVILEN